MPASSAPIDGYGDLHENLRFWLSRLAAAIAERVGRGAVIYDVGANDGELAIPLAAAGHQVVAFEPQPAARDRMAAKAAHRGRLQIKQCALGDAVGETSMVVFSDDTFSSLYRRPNDQLDRYGLTETDTIRVAVETLDALVTDGRVRPQPPELIKIDVEGHEAAVLRGARDVLSATHPALIVEYSCLNAANAGTTREEILTELKRLGYRHIFGLWRNSDPGLRTATVLGDCRIWNLVVVNDDLMDVVRPWIVEQE